MNRRSSTFLVLTFLLLSCSKQRQLEVGNGSGQFVPVCNPLRGELLAIDPEKKTQLELEKALPLKQTILWKVTLSGGCGGAFLIEREGSIPIKIAPDQNTYEFFKQYVEEDDSVIETIRIGSLSPDNDQVSNAIEVKSRPFKIETPTPPLPPISCTATPTPLAQVVAVGVNGGFVPPRFDFALKIETVSANPQPTSALVTSVIDKNITLGLMTDVTPQVATASQYNLMFLPTTLGVHEYTFKVTDPMNPTRTDECTAVIAVIDEPILPPACSITVTPNTLGLGEEFVIQLNLVGNGAVIQAFLDGRPITLQGNMFRLPVRALRPGSFVAEGLVIGPGGPGTCSQSYTIDGSLADDRVLSVDFESTSDATTFAGQFGRLESVGRTAGIVGSAGSFNGKPSNIEYPTPNLVNFPEGGAISVWVRPSSLPPDVEDKSLNTWFVFHRQENFVPHFPLVHLSYDKDGRFTCYFRDSAEQTVTLISQVAVPGQWHHVVCNIDPTNNRSQLFVNEMEIPSSSRGLAPRVTFIQGPVSVGRFVQDWIRTKFPPNGYFQGLIDELNVWNRPLSDEEILIVDEFPEVFH